MSTVILPVIPPGGKLVANHLDGLIKIDEMEAAARTPVNALIERGDEWREDRSGGT